MIRSIARSPALALMAAEVLLRSAGVEAELNVFGGMGCLLGKSGVARIA